MDRLEEFGILVLYTLAAISGGLGGCAVTAQQFLSQEGAGRVQMRLSWISAYTIIGVLFGILFAAYGLTIIELKHPTDIIGPACIAGFLGAALLGGANMTARFLLKRLGVEVIVTVRKDNQERRDSQ